jgi:hypothetical protein
VLQQRQQQAAIAAQAPPPTKSITVAKVPRLYHGMSVYDISLANSLSKSDSEFRVVITMSQPTIWLVCEPHIGPGSSSQQTMALVSGSSRWPRCRASTTA